MERDLHSPGTYDYRQYDRVWRRVAPDMEPYPDMADLPGQPTPAENAAPMPAPAAEEQLPGAQMDPCCMGSAAMEMLGVIQGFIEEELADCRYYQAFARQAPSWARQHLRQIATEEACHARRLMAVYYLSLPAAATGLPSAVSGSAWGSGAPPCGSATTPRPAAASTTPGPRTAPRIPAWESSWASSAPMSTATRRC